MKKKSSRLQPVERLAENKAKSAAAEMLSARNSHQTHEQKLEELTCYRLEYIEQFHSRAKNGMQANQLQQYQQFISQLDIAIQQQEKTVAAASMVLGERQNQWRHKHSHKRALNKVVSRFQQQEFSLEEKTEQDDQDERNTRKYNQDNKVKQ